MKNKLEILVKNMASPVVAINIWIHVGSNYEDEDRNGLSHFIEHMLFKGTEKRKVGEISKEIENLGGYFNAFTSYEATAYEITLPLDKLYKGLEILFDALENSSFDNEEIGKEAQVIIEECKMRDDTPSVRSWENLMKLSFRHHRYRRSIIGNEDMIKKFSRNNIVDFYHNYYRPENMTLILVGDINIDELLKEFDRFTIRAKGEFKPDPSPKEPLQKNFRYSHFRGDIERTYMEIGFHIPEELHPDTFSLELLCSILGDGRSSRLYQEIREKRRLASSIGAGDINGKDEGLFVISAVTDEDKVMDCLKAIWYEIKRFKVEPVTQEEIEKARISIEHDYLFGLETVDGLAENIGHYANLGDYTMSVSYIDNLKKVTIEDINSVAKKYFSIENCNVSIYGSKLKGKKDCLNISSEELKKIIQGNKSLDMDKDNFPNLSHKKYNPEPEKIILKNNVTLVVERDSSLPVVSIYAGFKGGLRYETRENNGLSRMMSRLMIKGTSSRKAIDIARGIESLGSHLSPRSGKDSFGLSMSILKRYLNKGLEIFFDVLNNPIFPDEEIEKEKMFILSEIREKSDDPMRICMELCDSLVFKTHPYGMATTGTEKTVKNISRAHIVDYYQKYLVGDNMYISAVGDVETEELIKQIEKLFTKKSEVLPSEFPFLEPEKPSETKRRMIKKKDIRQSSISIGFLGPPVTSEDYIPFIVLDSILNGMGSRLFMELRDIRGLAYAVFCYLESGIENGNFKSYIATGPELEKEAIKGMLHELKKIKEYGVTEKEVEKAKNMIKGGYEIALQERAARASRYSSYEILGLGYDRLQKYPSLIEKVMIEDVNSVARKYFELENYSLAIVRPKA